MRFSVVIPAYNAARTIGPALDSVLAQTVAPHEILVLDDGSTDDTAAVLSSYGERIRVLSRPNGGVARARNILCGEAGGDSIAFLDADDLWHPRYLEVQRTLLARQPEAIASFTHHADVLDADADAHVWGDVAVPAGVVGELIGPRAFLERYNRTPMQFQMSCFCLPAAALARLGPEPFYEGASGADDTYIHNLLPLHGAVVHTSLPLVAYRIIDGSISSNQLRMASLVVDVFRELAQAYGDGVGRDLARSFAAASASRKRDCAKFLMGAGRVKAARELLLESVGDSRQPASLAKSLGLLALTLAPRAVQPQWPSVERTYGS